MSEPMIPCPVCNKLYYKAAIETNGCCITCFLDNKTRKIKMTTLWLDAQGMTHEIEKMPTSYIENCLSLIDELMPKIIKRLNDNGERVASAQRELKIKQEQKAEMMRVLVARRVTANKELNKIFTCHSCKHSDKAKITYERPAELVCRKLGFTCKTLNFSCGNWENNNA